MNNAKQGGGIHAIDSEIILTKLANSHSFLSFVNNSAVCGGGLSLEGRSRIKGLSGCGCIIKFTNNTAQKGGAIYVDDYTNTDICTTTSYSLCFLRTPISWENWVEIDSSLGKNTLYGGLLDRCIARNDISNRYYGLNNLVEGINYLKEATGTTNNSKIKSLITSECATAMME